jgi:hypothetical protein
MTHEKIDFSESNTMRGGKKEEEKNSIFNSKREINSLITRRL